MSGIESGTVNATCIASRPSGFSGAKRGSPPQYAQREHREREDEHAPEDDRQGTVRSRRPGRERGRREPHGGRRERSHPTAQVHLAHLTLSLVELHDPLL
jgi:hypothetical protein